MKKLLLLKTVAYTYPIKRLYVTTSHQRRKPYSPREASIGRLLAVHERAK